jgi:hypothetical protein
VRRGSYSAFSGTTFTYHPLVVRIIERRVTHLVSADALLQRGDAAATWWAVTDAVRVWFDASGTDGRDAVVLVIGHVAWTTGFNVCIYLYVPHM